MTTVKNTSLGKNRDTPPSTRAIRYTRAQIRVATAQRLVSGYYRRHGENLRGSSVVGCGRWRAHGVDPTHAEMVVAGGEANMEGHFKCGCNWTCDTCASATVARTRSWLRGCLFPTMIEQGLSSSLLTLTMAHAYDDDWHNGVRMLRDAYALFDRRMAKHYKRILSRGKFKALEATIGANGLHGHFHVLLTHSADITVEELEALAAIMRKAWAKAVAEVGGRVNGHGFDLKPHVTNDYVAKMEASHEMAAHSTKQARKGGKSLQQLLDRAGRGDAQCAAEWVRAVEALSQASRFHAGALPSKLGIVPPSEWVDEEPTLSEDTADGEVPEAPMPLSIKYPIGDHLMATSPDLGRPGIAMMKRAAVRGGAKALLRMVGALCADYRKKHPVNLHTMCSLDVVDVLMVDLFPDIMERARNGPLTPAEVDAYLAERKRLRAVGAGSSACAEAAAHA